MTAPLFFGLLLTATLSVAVPPEQPQPAEDPCELARRIAQSPPCLAGRACEALDLWREAFGQPHVVPVGAGRDGDRAMVAKAPSGRLRQLGRNWPPTFDCRVR